MEDSSTNPYIPQESEAIRQKVYERQSPLGRIVKWALIVTAVVAVLVGGGLFFVVPKTTAVDQQARVKLADILQPPDQVLKRVDVASELGFHLKYDNRIYNTYAEVGDSSAGSDSSSAVLSGQTYENNDLRTMRAYNYIRIRPIESVDTARTLSPIPPQLELFATVTDKDLTTAAAVPENKSLSKLSLFVKLDSDKRQAKKVTDDKTVVTIDATKPVSTTIGDVEYQKVRYTTTNDNHRISNVKYDDCYYTIQYDQPYSICISNVRPTSVSAASLVEQVFDSITFEQPQIDTASSADGTTDSTKKTSFVFPLARLTQATTDDGADAAADSDNGDSSQSPLITIKPSYYTDAASLTSIAKTQPSVVRIGTLYCTDLALKLESGATATTLTDACVGYMASGVFISKDGYVATTGHAIREQKKAAIDGYINFASDQDQMLDRLQRVLDYLLTSKIILQSDADYLKDGAANGNQDALAKVENIASVIPDNFITAINEQYTYAIQPSDKPIVINHSDTNKPSFAYSDTVLSAKYVASNYDATKSIQEVFGSETPKSDVGLLKVEGDFPDVPINPKENIKSNDTINTVGYPAYTDSSLTIDKIRNLPVVTTSKVDQAYEKDGVRFIQTNTPVLPGNDGSPVIDSNGQLVGFAVYGMSYCPDQLCFGNGTVRSSAELLKLVADNNIVLATGSSVTVSWADGVDQFFKANYASSANSFATSGSLYQFNRWADPLNKLAVAGEGTALDTSFMNQLLIIMIWSLVILVILCIVLAIAFYLHRSRISRLQVGHYGTTATNQPTMPSVAPPVAPISLPPTQPQSYAEPAPIIRPVQSPPPQSSPILPIHDQPATSGFSGASQPQTPASTPVQPQQQPPTSIPVQQKPAEPQSGPVEDPFYK
jgi:S1-C subfamily serine protease